jgi:glutamine amidotransferase
MCRHLAWLGEPRSLAELALAPPFPLLRQSYAPRRQRYGTVDADGRGAGFCTPGGPEPARWRSDIPDRSLVEVTPEGVAVTPLSTA